MWASPFGSDGTIDTEAPMLRRSFKSTIVSHTEPMLVSKWQYHVTDDVWSFERHAVSEGQDSWFEKNWHFALVFDFTLTWLCVFTYLGSSRIV